VVSKRHRLTRFPVPVADREYAVAASELEERLRGLPGVVAVYRTGRVSAPGISDLDRVAVVASTYAVPDIWRLLSERTRHIAMHTPFLVDVQTFRRHRWFADLEPLEITWGDPLVVEERPVPDYCETLLATEALVVTALKLVKQNFVAHVKVRPLLCELNNLARDLNLARVERSDAPRAWALADYVRRVREEWWELPHGERGRRVERLLSLAIPSVAEALQSLSAALDVGVRDAPLRLNGAWRNVWLVPGELDSRRPLRKISIFERSRQLSEAQWQWMPRRVGVPSPILSFLNGAGGHSFDEFHIERQRVVRRYRNFLRRSPGYSSLGTAHVFGRS
jgi:hypothetical protein